MMTVTQLVRAIRRLEEYEEWKKQVFLRDRFTCQWCGARNGRRRVIEADHVVGLARMVRANNLTTLEEAKRCSILWDVDNGRCLCHSCHERTDSYPVQFRRMAAELEQSREMQKRDCKDE